MLIHNVYFWLRKDLSADDRATFESELRRLETIDYLERGVVGSPAPTQERPVTDHSFDFAACLIFKTMTDHDFYQSDCPDHTRFVSTCKAFWDRVVIYDTAPLR